METSYVPFSQCDLWQNQREFYINEGINAWNNKLPFYATSNPFIADVYAKLIIRYVQDLLRLNQYKPTEPLYILELGAGSGQFSYYTLRALLVLQQQLGLTDLKFKYIMSDFAEANIEFWQTQPNLQPYVQQGYLDFAYFDAAKPQAVRLQKARKTLTKKILKNPLVVFANYVFDSLKHDFFKVTAGKLQLGYINKTAKIEQVLDNKSIPLTKIDPGFDFKNIELPYYDNPILDNVLEEYRQAGKDECFTFSAELLLSLDYLRNLSGNRLLLLTSDKGYSNFLNYQPEIVLHGQIFSLTINFAALRKYAHQYEGDNYLQSMLRNMNTALLVFGNTLTELPELSLAINEYLEKLSPGGLMDVVKHLNHTYLNCPINTLLTYLQTTGWDNQLFDQYFAIIIQQLKAVNDERFNQFVLDQIERIAANFYYLPGASDTWSNIGNLLLEFQQYEKALTYYQQSINYFGETDLTLCNMASCYYALNNYEQAKMLFIAACKLNKDNIQAFGWLAKLQGQHELKITK